MGKRVLFIVIAPFIIFPLLSQGKRIKKFPSHPAFYFFTETEQKIFSSLTLKTERDRFLKEFWWLHDPDLTTAINEFKLEVEKRISFANRYFSRKGLPGWKTDKGLVYILLGPPSEVEKNPKAGSNAPKEVWIYRTTIGGYNHLAFSFFDPSGTGTLTLPSITKKRLLSLKNAFLEDLLSIGSRWRGIKLTHYPRRGVINPSLINRVYEERRIASEIHISRLTLPFPLPLGKLLSPPYQPSSVKPLLEKATFQLRRKLSLAPITVGVYYRDSLYKLRGRMNYATLDIRLLVRDKRGKIKAEDGVKISYGLSLRRFRNLTDELLYVQFPLVLPPGRYKILLLVKDCLSNRLIYQTEEGLSVPDFSNGKLAISSLILSREAKEIKVLREEGERNEPFTLSNYRIVPNLRRIFYSRGELNLFYEIYNLRLNKKTGKTSCRIDYIFFRNGRFYSKAPAYFLPSSSQRNRSVLTRFRLRHFQPGNYTLQVLVQDQVGKTSTSGKIEFVIK